VRNNDLIVQSMQSDPTIKEYR